MDTRALIGMLTPSSNTVLEPLTAEMLKDVTEASAHFSRFRVTEISLSDYGLRQFDNDARVAAAELLADAKCQVIAWNGTSAGWLGFEHDVALCEAIEKRTGARATSSVLANNTLFRRDGIREFGLVTPYTDDVQAAIIKNFDEAGYRCVAERHLGIKDNFSFSEVSAETIEQLVREVASDGACAISIICTNLIGAPLAPRLEPELDITLYDSVSVVMLKSLELAGIDIRRLARWGRIFQHQR
ncbi:MAG: aspartate/glutamate racemase family protein [Pseudomonadota bacterium]